jgi:hypothetical protein
MPRLLPTLLCLAVLAVALTARPDRAAAMPGFARKYSMSCKTCHAPFPKLKPYAFDFIAEGYRLPEGEPPRATIDTGDDLLTLTRDFPIGMRLDLYGAYEHGETPNNDLTVPFLLKIISGGPVTDSISYYFYFFLSEKGELAGIEDALLYFRDLFGSGLNLTVGQFAVNDPLYKSETRLTRESYMLYKRKPGESMGNLTYERGAVLDYGFDFGLDLVAMVLNGNGIHTAGDAFDVDDYKTGFFRAAQGLGPFSIGGFAYYGKEERAPTVTAGAAAVAPAGGLGALAAAPLPAKTNTILYVGGDVSAQFEVFELNALYLRRTDTNPTFLAGGPDSAAQGVMAEAIWRPGYDQGRFCLTGLYNWFASDLKDAAGADPLAYHSATLSASWLLGRNARLMAEYTFVLRDGALENGHRATLGVVSAF